MAGVVLKVKFVSATNKKFNEYISYINRNEAIRNAHFEEYSAYVSNYMDNPLKQQDVNLSSEKTSALFTRTKDSLSVNEKRQLQEKFVIAQKNKSPMWQNVISFENKFLAENGIYDFTTGLLDENKIREVTRKSMCKMLEKENMTESAVWSASIHYNTDNIHVHIAVVEPTPTRQLKEFTRRDKKGNEYKSLEYRAALKFGTLDAMKSQVINNLIDRSSDLKKINTLIRDSIVGGRKDKSTAYDRKLSKDFFEIYRNLPKDKRLWFYNMSAMSGVRPKLDALTENYINYYMPKEYVSLLESLSKQENFLKAAYGEGADNRYQNYKQNMLNDLYARKGNALLKEMKIFDKQSASHYGKTKKGALNKFRFQKNQCGSLTAAIHRALKKDYKAEQNKFVYENLLNEINKAHGAHEHEV